MSLSDITKELLKAYNEKFDKNEKDEENIIQKPKKFDENYLAEKYNELLLCCEQQISTPKNYETDSDNEDYDPVKMYNNQTTTPRLIDNSKDVCNTICKMNYIEDKSFVNKMMTYRIAEIQKKLMFIKYNIEIYKYIITGILNLQYKRDAKIITSSSIEEELKRLLEIKANVKKYLEEYVIKLEQYILNTTICKYLFLQDRYNKLVVGDAPVKLL
jgi:hypothetical protein